jgi:hypothetical protein
VTNRTHRTLSHDDSRFLLNGKPHQIISGSMTYYRLRGLEPERLRWNEFEAFAARCLTLEFQSPGYELYRWEGS